MSRMMHLALKYPGAALPAKNTVFLTNCARSSGLALFKSL
jgi:hypothetical protein